MFHENSGKRRNSDVTYRILYQEHNWRWEDIWTWHYLCKDTRKNLRSICQGWTMERLEGRISLKGQCPLQKCVYEILDQKQRRTQSSKTRWYPQVINWKVKRGSLSKEVEEKSWLIDSTIIDGRWYKKDVRKPVLSCQRQSSKAFQINWRCDEKPRAIAK